MPFNENRLYIALYPSGVRKREERKYHWAFLIGPKVENESHVPATRYHVKNPPMQGWIYEEENLPNAQSMTNLLARILIAKVEDEERIINILRSVPVIQNDPNWRCRTWVAHALAEIAGDGKAVGAAELNWQRIEDAARQYVDVKIWAGRYQSGVDILKPKPTWDMLEDKEIVP